jgi:hypothetical protein
MSKHGGLARYRAVELNLPHLYAKVVAGEMPITHAFAVYKGMKSARVKADEMQAAATGNLAQAMAESRCLTREELQTLRAFILAIMPALDDADKPPRKPTGGPKLKARGD